MIIQDYLDAPNKKNLLQEIIIQAKLKNEKNPAILSREDEYLTKSQEESFAKPFQGCPIVIKDNILLQDTVSTFGSTMGQDYIAPYDATIVKKLKAAWFLTIGKSTMDEFAMGSSGENSSYAIPHNVVDTTRVAGGSSSGSAVAVASSQVPVSIGTDTGGSVRQPAAFNGIYGLKTSYGAISRYGVQAMASSFDQVGIFANSIDDIETVFDTISWVDERDATTRSFDFTTNITWLKWLRIGVPGQYFADGLDPLIKTKIQETLTRYERQGAILVDLDLPLIDAGVSVYYILVSAEVSTNLSRFDGLKFGLQDDTTNFANYHEYLGTMRDQGFGDEVKRRILLWAHVLSASEYEGLYVKASDIRAQVTKEFIDILETQVDVIMGPTTPVLPRKLWENQDDPISAYLADAYTVIANLTWLPALSVPVGMVESEGKKLPVWLQLMTRYGGERDLFVIAKMLKIW